MYTDKNGTPVKVGDIIYYDEGEGGSKGIHDIIERDGVLYGRTQLYNYHDKWVLCYHREVIDELRYYQGILCEDKVLVNAVLIGNVKDNSDFFSTKWAIENYPLGEHVNK